jgi:tetratricopeptide (TPR) repeat protein
MKKEDCEKKAEHFEEIEQFGKAYDFYKKAGKPERVRALMEREARSLLEGTQSFFAPYSVANYLRAAKLWEELGRPEEAAKSHEFVAESLIVQEDPTRETGDVKEIAKHYEKAGMLVKAQTLYQSAAQFYSERGQTRKSQMMYRELERVNRLRKNPMVATQLKRSKNLTSRLTPVIAIAGIGAGAFFFSTKITGNVVGVSTQTSSIIGIVLFLVGLVAGLFWVRNKK